MSNKLYHVLIRVGLCVKGISCTDTCKNCVKGISCTDT